MDINEMKIREAKEIAKMFADFDRVVVKNTEPWVDNDDIRIVVLQRGWILVGRYQLLGDKVFIRDASVIRNWGTTKGLGELASNGPTDKTILDKCQTCECHELTVCFTMKCEISKWLNKL